MRVNFSDQGAKNSKVKFIELLLRKFADSNDIKFGSTLKYYIKTPQGSKSLAAWAKSQGYNVSYWCMESIKYDDKTFWVGFGIDIDESCPLIVELKLRTC